jgi:predicted flavoprotein YhiN
MKIVIIGAGAAGVFAAISAAEAMPSAEVVVLEKSSQVLAKVKISGGGRCNVTHNCFEPQVLIKNYPRGSRELLGPFHCWQPRDTIAWFEQRGVELKAEVDGRMFPMTDRSQTIIDCLLDVCDELGVEIRTGVGLMSVERLMSVGNLMLGEELSSVEKQSLTEKLSSEESVSMAENELSAGEAGPLYCLHLSDGSVMECDRLLLATGGNASSKAFEVARQLGHTVEPIVPSLFTFNCDDVRIKDLPGIAVKETITRVPAFKLEAKGPTLITHWGLSGPGILRLSAWGARVLHLVNHRFELEVDWLPNYSLQQLQEIFHQARKRFGVKTIVNSNLFDEIPRRLWESLVLNAGGIMETMRWSDLNKNAESNLINSLHSCRFNIEGKSTNKEEFVSCGGIKLSEVNFKTMESKLSPGLFFAGEILDIDGITGGFNFQAAWTTGRIAGESMVQKS